MNEELRARLMEYRREVRQLWLKEIPIFGIFSAVVVFALTWALTHYTGGPKTGPGTIDWRLCATLNWIVLMVPPIKMLTPDRPTEESIAHEKVLNAIGNTFLDRRQGSDIK